MVQTDEAVPAGTTLEVTVSAGPDMREVLLTAAIPSTEVSFTAPASAGQVMVTAMATPDTAEGALEVAVSNAQTLTVTVSARQVPLALQLLEVPAEVVARDDFAVRVLSVPAVPEGATLAVTVVFDGTTSAAMTLLPGISSAVISVTAPGRLEEGLELLTASMVMVDEPDALQVTVVEATATVAVVAQSVALTLAVPPSVTVGADVEVTVGVAPALLADTTLTVEVNFGEASTQVTLSDRVSSQTLSFTALMAGQLEVRAEAVDVEPDGLVVAAPATLAVTVSALEVELVLQLLEVPAEVVARDVFDVTVVAAPEVPAGATVTVTVVFDGTTSAAMTLTPGISSAVFSITAPGRLEEDLELLTASMVTVAEPDALQVTVAEATATVTVVPQSVQLTLAVLDPVITGADVEVTVGVVPALLADTTLTVEVTFGESTEQVTLRDMTPPQAVSFQAPAAGQLAVSAREIAVEPLGLVVAASATQTVEVLAEGTVALTLEAPLNVTVGATFTVTVGVSAGTQLMEGATLTATISFPAGTADSAEQEVVLTSAEPTTWPSSWRRSRRATLQWQ